MPPLFTSVINTRAQQGAHSPVTPARTRTAGGASDPHAGSYRLRHDLLVLLEWGVISRHLARAATSGSCGGRHTVTQPSAPRVRSAAPRLPFPPASRAGRGSGSAGAQGSFAHLPRTGGCARSPWHSHGRSLLFPGREGQEKAAGCPPMLTRPAGTCFPGDSVVPLGSARCPKPSGRRRRGGTGYLLPLQRGRDLERRWSSSSSHRSGGRRCAVCRSRSKVSLS